MLAEDIAESGEISPIGLSFFGPSVFLDAALFIAFVNVSSSAWHLFNGVCVAAVL
jgi:hypothetical protein